MDPSQIEYINALAPFDHGVWQGEASDGQKVIVGDRALFCKRSEWLVNKIVAFLINKFTLTTLQSMRVLEVGAYDGWVLTQICKQIKFLEAVGVEPRRKNIKKGEIGRKLANISTQSQFIQGTADELEELFPRKDFDIVICLGMLHHVSSTYDTIANLCSKSSKIAILDSMIIPELQNDIASIKPYVNTRDIVYHGEEGVWSIAAFKFESPYGDGSRPNYGIVNIPSAGLIEMSLRSCGFGKSNLLGDESDFFDVTGQRLRGVKEVLLISQREISKSEIYKRWMEKVENSEDVFCHTILPDILLLAMSKLFAGFMELDVCADVQKATTVEHNANIEKLVLKVISEGIDEDDKDILFSHINNFDDKHFHIMSVIFRSPYEKIILEVAKFFLKNRLPDLAIKYLKIIVCKPGCDWWSFYRSCYILRESFRAMGDNESSQHYQKLLLLSNENFPFKVCVKSYF